jgi:hypothetical protein
MIKEHNELIEEQDFFEEDSNLDFFWFYLGFFSSSNYVYFC